MVDHLLAVPTLLKVVGSLGLILAVNRLTRRLTVSVLVGTAVLGLWSGRPVGALLETAWDRLASADGLGLVVAVVMVIWLSSQMASAGVMTDLVRVVRARTGPRASLAVLPAVIGLLPMPGGAIFSAPLVDRADEGGRVPPLLKTHINYWFRHIWEYWWPLYPGVLVAIAVTGLEVWQFTLLQMPMTLLAVGVGAVWLLRRVPPEPARPGEPAGRSAAGGDPGQADGEGTTPADRGAEGRPADGDPRGRGDGPASEPPPPASARDGAEMAPRFLGLVSPVLVVIGTYAALRLAWWGLGAVGVALPPLGRYTPMTVGLVLAMATLQVRRPLARGAWRRILLAPRPLALAVLVALLRVYGALVEMPIGGRPPLVAAMQAEMDAWGLPTVGMIALLPFVAGVTTGICVGFVGASFPVVVSMVGSEAPLPHLLAAVVLAFGFGYMGMMLSPVHVCLIVTNEHFKTRLAASLRGLVPAAAAVLVGVCLYAAAIRLVGG